MTIHSINTRALAAQAVLAVVQQGRSLTQVMPQFKQKCTKLQDAAFLQAMVYGALRFYSTLAFFSEQLLEKPLKEKDQVLLILIIIGLYQLIHLRVPHHAALSETVNAARVLKRPWGASLVNAVLRNYLRRRDELQKALSSNEAAFYAHPAWLIEAIQEAWPAYWQSILNANNTEPPFSLRVNINKITRVDFLKKLQLANIIATEIPQTTAGVVLEKAVEVNAIPGFKEGLFSVQDAAAQQAAELLFLTPNLRVLDACSAPGGKTIHLLEKEPFLKEVVAIDLTPDRTKLITENLKRLQYQATVMTANAAKPDDWWDKKPFDRILVDEPCSATGVIRRHPDIKYLRKPQDISALARQQLALLKALWPLLKTDGYLLYVTCSIFPQENQDVLINFLNEQKDAVIVSFSLPQSIPQTVGQQILPGENGWDGFYYACLQKKP